MGSELTQRHMEVNTETRGEYRVTVDCFVHEEAVEHIVGWIGSTDANITVDDSAHVESFHEQVTGVESRHRRDLVLLTVDYEVFATNEYDAYADAKQLLKSQLDRLKRSFENGRVQIGYEIVANDVVQTNPEEN